MEGSQNSQCLIKVILKFPLIVKEFLKGISSGLQVIQRPPGSEDVEAVDRQECLLFLTKEAGWVLSVPNRLVVGNFSSALTVQRC